MDKIRIGIIGAGGIAAKSHLPELAELQDRCEVALISGRKESRLRLLCEKFSVGGYTQNYEDVIADDRIDAVLIATPHPQHVAWGIKALEAGKHVMMQKPLCGDMAEANAFVAAVEKSDRTVMCLPHFSPRIYAVRQGIRDGVIGRVSGAHARTSHGGPEVYYVEVRNIFGETGGETGDLREKLQGKVTREQAVEAMERRKATGEPLEKILADMGLVESHDDLWFFDSRRASVGALFDMGVYAVAHIVALLGSVQRVAAIVTT
ncbi:MAG: Gfo/Idh/MocA family oxidoreductase, partial [Armatimonadota bacterium]|nr:Gfo/Idh/MocA family oxidoreductase [Armatimonadota bacterium]